MDDKAEVVALEIDAVVADPEPVQRPTLPFQLSETLQFGGHHLLGEASEFAKNGQLKLLGHLCELGGAGGVEDDLERAHRLSCV